MLTPQDIRPSRIPLNGVARPLEWHQLIAVSVIAQAVADVENASTPAHVRDKATAFLAGDADFRWWCDVAGLDPDRVLAECRRWSAKRGNGQVATPLEIVDRGAS